MSTEKNKKESAPIAVDTFFVRIQKWYESNQKKINYLTTAVLVVAVLVVLYFTMWRPNRQKKAELAIFKAEQYFAQDSMQLALNGDGVYEGLLDVISTYPCTKTGNRAKYEAGICYLRMGDFDNAIKYLKKFKGKDKLVSVNALGAIGDAYAEKSDWNSAYSYYQKASKIHPNALLTPTYLYRAGLSCEKLGKWAAAEDIYTTLQHEYPASYEAMDIDKRIAYAKAKQGK